MDRPADWERIAELAETMGLDPHETIRPLSRSGLMSVQGRAVAELAALSPEEESSARLEVLGTLGEGGMGIVRLGRQIALDRTVAIKELTDDRRGDPGSVLKLLQEAWVAGSLEHPNIVPVYDIEVRRGDEPRIVMKRIQGSPWDELFADAEGVAERFGENDLLEWNLHVLMQVANALRYAHDRGIVLIVINRMTGITGGAHAAHLFFLWTLVATFATLLVEWRLWPTMLGQGLGLVAVPFQPTFTLGAIIAANSVFVVNIMIIWWPSSLRGPYDGDARVR